MEEKRKAVITVTEGETIDVNIDFFPSPKRSGVCGRLAMIGFQAIVQANILSCTEDEDQYPHRKPPLRPISPPCPPEIRRTRKNEKPLTIAVVKSYEGKPLKQTLKHFKLESCTMQDKKMKDTGSLWDQTLEEWQEIARTEGACNLCRQLMLDPRFKPNMPGVLGKFIGEMEGYLIPELLLALTLHLEKTASFSEHSKEQDAFDQK